MFRHTMALAAAAACAAVVLCCASCGSKPSEYASPESFIVDPQTGVCYVSNVNRAKPPTTDGKPTREDNNGYITTLDANLTIVKQKFVEGGRDGVELNDPKGMAIVGDTLWVADLKFMRAFDKKTGRNTANVSLEAFDAVFLNDVAAGPDGLVFVSDNLKNKIFQIDTKNGNAPSVLAEGSDLNGPNGLYWAEEEKLLYVACWNGGTILTVNLEGEVGTFMINPEKFSHLDGIDRDEAGNFYVSDYHRNVVYRITPDKRVEALEATLTTPADISLDRAHNRLLVPQFTADKITTIPLANGE
jgi:DNA-binding beta-propeller fold protein YncE